MESKTVSKLSNAFSTGGGGVNFENDVQAVFFALSINRWLLSYNE